MSVKSEELRVKSFGLHCCAMLLIIKEKRKLFHPTPFTLHSSLFTVKQGVSPCFT